MTTKVKTSPVITTKSLFDLWQQETYGNITREYRSPLSLSYDELINVTPGNIFYGNQIEGI